jgi:TRAP-type transport system small permease protein
MAYELRASLWVFAKKLNWLVERLCVVLVAVLVIDIWFGIVARYFLELGITWTEELARYIMIWAALLAISSAAHRREHIGLVFVLAALPPRPRQYLQAMIDCLGIAFFLFLVVYGIRMTIDGTSQFAMIFGMSMVVPFASVPVGAGLTALQILLVAIRPPDASDAPDHLEAQAG